MASSYTTSLKIQEIGNGEQSGVWGTTTNTNWQLAEQAIAGVQTITMSNANYTLTNLNGVLDEARNMVLVIQGTNSGIYQVIAPLNQPKMYVVSNQTTGGYAITIGASSGSVVSIPNGTTAQVYTDGTNFFSAQTGSAGNFNINGDLTVSGNAYGQKGFDGTTVTAQGYGLRVRMDSTNTGAILQFTNNAANAQIGSIVATGSTLALNPPTGGTVTAPTASPGTNTTQIATTAFALANGIPSGAIVMWPTASAPSGYLNCDGSAVSRTTYATLFALFGTTFGSGDGSTTFNLPNYTNCMPYGTTIGATGGSADAIVVSHTHTASVDTASLTGTIYANGNRSGFGGGTGIVTASGSTGSAANQTGVNVPDTLTINASHSHTVTNASAGVSGTNANLPPYLGINFIIKT